MGWSSPAYQDYARAALMKNPAEVIANARELMGLRGPITEMAGAMARSRCRWWSCKATATPVFAMTFRSRASPPSCRMPSCGWNPAGSDVAPFPARRTAGGSRKRHPGGGGAGRGWL